MAVSARRASKLLSTEDLRWMKYIKTDTADHVTNQTRAEAQSLRFEPLIAALFWVFSFLAESDESVVFPAVLSVFAATRFPFWGVFMFCLCLLRVMVDCVCRLKPGDTLLPCQVTDAQARPPTTKCGWVRLPRGATASWHTRMFQAIMLQSPLFTPTVR